MKPRFIYIYCFILFGFCKLSAQHLKNTDTLNIKGKMEYRLRKSLDKADYKKALSITDQMLSYGLKNNDSMFLVFVYEAKATLHELFERNIQNAKQYTTKALKIYDKKQHHNSIVRLNTQLARILKAEGKLDSCLYLLNEISKNYISDSISKKTLSHFYNQKELSYYAAGRIDSSLHYTFKRLPLIDQNNNHLLGVIYTVLSENFKSVDDLDKALNYVNTALYHLLKQKNQFPKAQCNAYLLKASICIEAKQYEEALENIENGKNTIKNYNRPDHELRIRILKFIIQQKENAMNQPMALSLKGLDITKVAPITLFNFYISKLSRATSNKNWVEASSIIKKMEAIYPNVSNLRSKQDFYKLSSQFWAAIKDFEKSNKALKQYLQIKEKINTQQQTYMAYDLDQKYQVSKKNEEIIQQDFRIQKQENQLLKKEKHQTYLTLSIISAILGFFSLLFIYQQRQKIKNNEILVLQRKQEIVKLESLIDGEEKERNRIAQDLHDGLNGDLAVIKYKLTSLPSLTLNDTEKTIHKETIEMLDNTVEQVRRISHNLSPASLQNFNLIDAIRQFCNTINSSHSLHLSFQYFGNQLILEKEKETAIYRIIQELIHNIIKHAKATEALVQINKHDDFVNIIVEDNGDGFDLSSKNRGIGLQNVTSRINFLNANLDIVSNQNGSTFTIELDLNKIHKT